MICPSLPAYDFLSGLLRFIDCQAQTIGAQGYQALAAPGSVFSIVLASLLAIFIALSGYRMMLGHVPSVREGVLAFVKIGVVLVLATSWPSYRTLVYDVVLRGPAELSATIGKASSLPGAEGTMVSRLEAVDRALVSLAVVGAGDPPLMRRLEDRHMPPLFGGFEAFALGGARILYLIGIVGAFATVRFIVGLLLALAPFFFAFMLFDATRGLFAGWIRVLAGATIGALSVSIILSIELALLEPWLSSLLASRAANRAVPSAPVELLVVTSMFGIALITMLWASARLAKGFQFAVMAKAADAIIGANGDSRRRELNFQQMPETTPAASHSRAAAIVDAVASTQRREDMGAPMQLYGGSRVPVQTMARDDRSPAAPPLGQSFRRRTVSRVSARAGRRDKS